LDIRPDDALRKTNRRFRWRFRRLEAQFGGSRERLQQASLEELEAAWQAAKASERSGTG
jgi:ATP diphosphatase